MPALLIPLLAVAGVQAAAVGAAWFLRTREAVVQRHLPSIVGLAVGVLLATALLHLMPEAVSQLGGGLRAWAPYGGAMLALFAAERVFFVLTGASAEPEVGLPAQHHRHHGARSANLILASMLHSLVDGAAVGVAFLADRRVGWLTAFAVALHEIPHRMGDFAVLLQLQVPASRALRLCIVAGLPALLGVLLVFAAGERSAAFLALLLPLSAGSFLYIAMVNLLPEMQHEHTVSGVLLQLGCVAAGVALVLALGTAG